jgi:hypothetical protein
MNQQPQKPWFARNWMWLLPLACLTPVALCAGGITMIVMLVFGVMKSADVYQESLRRVQAHAEVQSELGAPLEPGFLVTGEIEVSGPSGKADIAYSVSGSRGTGTVYVIAEKRAGRWTYDTLEVEIESTGERIDLLSEQ